MSFKIHIFIKPSSGCCYHRIYHPLDNIDFQEGDSVTMGVYGEDESIPEGTNIVFFNRDIKTNPESLYKECKERNIKIVVDIDDFWELNANHYLSDTSYMQSYVPRMLSFIKLADVIVTTNKQLKEKLLPLNPNVVVFPNTMVFADTPCRGTQGQMRFGYCGGITHLHDVNLLRHSFEKLGGMQDVTSKAVFNLCGVDTKTYSPTWNAMSTTFSLAKSYNIYGALPLTDYMEHYKEIDVVLVPLVSNTFSSCKSILKIVEAASMGIPCIVSQTLPYTELIDAPGILWVQRNSDWVKHIKYCVNNPGYVVEAGKALHKYVGRRYDSISWGKLRYKFFKSLIA